MDFAFFVCSKIIAAILLMQRRYINTALNQKQYFDLYIKKNIFYI
ncbi:hypothetical protein HMPREF9444_00729 [Succinatimonas hippei YIT 12066]|uniref:Uncharacterized protein n=1 Tax=Succinatimonas hippei (strain DSM 22608 / JCM 16073 / KCTC 15190 / YIT 12066) TaxID=762983 RepID=E8LJ56_SUCHY|nr:hypothetical protein HMPREF9444_00729 [Succinatimonas hippei YIT 12066]